MGNLRQRIVEIMAETCDLLTSKMDTNCICLFHHSCCRQPSRFSNGCANPGTTNLRIANKRSNCIWPVDPSMRSARSRSRSPAWFHICGAGIERFLSQRAVRFDASNVQPDGSLKNSNGPSLGFGETGFPGTSRHTLQPHWGQFNSS